MLKESILQLAKEGIVYHTVGKFEACRSLYAWVDEPYYTKKFFRNQLL